MWNGRQLLVSRRSVRGLLFFLAAQTKPATRDQLCLLFWADQPQDHARRNLTRLLTHLRRALPCPDILCVNDERVYLLESEYWCDVRAFKTLTSASLSEKPGPQDLSEKQAADLYNGPFLDGFYLPDSSEYDNWISQERSALENCYMEVLSGLISNSSQTGDYLAGRDYARRYLEVDSLAEDIHRRLIWLYARTGERTRAIRQYEECVAILERELGASPLPETRAIYQAVLQGEAVQAYERVEIAPPTWLRLLQVDIPMVGRGSTMQRLYAALVKAKKGQGGFVLVDGEPGIGKSRLLHDFTLQDRQDCLVLAAAGERSAGKAPYRALVEAFRCAPVSRPGGLATVWVNELSRLLPELAPAAAVRRSYNRDEDRLRLYEAMYRFIFALSVEYRTLVLALDDLHWIDRASLQWLSFFAQQLLDPGSRVLVVGTYRSEDYEKVKDLRDILARLKILEEIHLEGLGVKDVQELLTQTIGARPGLQNLAGQLHEASGGNPFFLIEILRTMEDEGKLGEELEDLVDLPIPQGVQEAVNRRLGRLSGRSRQVLEAGAVIGSTFDFSTVRYTAGRSSLETSASLDDLARRKLLLEKEDGYRFVHDLVRKATAAATSSHRHRLLHLRAGQAIEKYHPGEFTSLAEHFDAAGELEQALRYHSLAARAAETLFAWAEAETHFNRMLTLLNRLDSNLSQPGWLYLRGEIFESLAQLHFLQGHLAERDDYLAMMADLAEASQDRKLELLSCTTRIRYLNQDGRYLEALEAAQSCLPLAVEAGENPTHYRLLSQIAFSYHFLGKPDKMLAALEAARAIEDDSIDPALRAFVAARLGFSHQRLGDYAAALKFQQEARDHFRRKGDQTGALQMNISLGNLLANLGWFTEARKALNEILAHARKNSLRPDEAHALVAFGALHQLQGDYPQAVRHYQEALGMYRSLSRPHIAASAETALGFTYYQLGDWERSRFHLLSALERVQAIGQRLGMAEGLIQLAILDIREAHWEEAHTRLAEGMKLAADSQAGELLAAGLAAQASLERATGQASVALKTAAESARRARQIGLVNVEMWALTEAGLALCEVGQIDQASAQLASATELVNQAGESWIGAERVHMAYAQILEMLGDSPGAQVQAILARSVIERKAACIQSEAERQVFFAQYPTQTFAG
jgi:DNA-binding SARP family transcriptional activator/tetratricopeptide (TPR) repeat protein